MPDECPQRLPSALMTVLESTLGGFLLRSRERGSKKGARVSRSPGGARRGTRGAASGAARGQGRGRRPQGCPASRLPPRETAKPTGDKGATFLLPSPCEKKPARPRGARRGQQWSGGRAAHPRDCALGLLCRRGSSLPRAPALAPTMLATRWVSLSNLR